MVKYWIGTSGYAYREWRGRFYPDALSEAEELRYFAARIPTVEIGQTFYKMPNVRLLQGWAKEVPERFAFSLKAPRRITHDLRLRDAAEVVTDFCETARALKNRLGPILFQMPPFLKRDIPRLEDFLHQMEPGSRMAFEFRNGSWFCDELYECLQRFEVALCIVDSPDRESPWVATAPFGYLRFRQPEYDDEMLAERAARMGDLAGGWTDVFGYFKHEADARGPALAQRLAEVVAGVPEAIAAEL